MSTTFQQETSKALTRSSDLAIALLHEILNAMYELRLFEVSPGFSQEGLKAYDDLHAPKMEYLEIGNRFRLEGAANTQLRPLVTSTTSSKRIEIRGIV